MANFNKLIVASLAVFVTMVSLHSRQVGALICVDSYQGACETAGFCVKASGAARGSSGTTRSCTLSCDEFHISIYGTQSDVWCCRDKDNCNAARSSLRPSTSVACLTSSLALLVLLPIAFH